MDREGRDEDALTSACVAVAWLILANKPFYPLYLWLLAGADAVRVSLATLIAAPFYAALPFLARRRPLPGRAGLVIVGTLDTLIASFAFGSAAGVELFLFACLLLGALSFSSHESRVARASVFFVFVAFVIARALVGDGLHAWTADEAQRLFALNIYSAAALCAFIGWRFAPLAR